MKWAAFAGGLAALCISTASFAQTAQTPVPDPARLQLARQVVEAVGGASAARTQLTALYSGMGQLLNANMPANQAKLTATVLKYISEEMVKAVPELLDETVAIYANRLTERELRDLLAWQQSESARSIATKAPLILQDSIARQGPRLRAIQAGLVKTVIEKACQENACTPAQRQAVTAALAKAIPQPSS